MTAFVDAIHALDDMHGAHAADDSILLADNPTAAADAALDDELAMIMLDAHAPLVKARSLMPCMSLMLPLKSLTRAPSCLKILKLKQQPCLTKSLLMS